MFADWRNARINGKLRATFSLLEKITICPSEIGPEDLNALRTAGVSVRALLDAAYICVGFNMIARIADALGFKVPSEELFLRGARLLKVFGYRRLSGYWIGVSNNKDRFPKNGLTNLAKRNSVSINIHSDDPYARKMERLRYAVVSSPGSLPPDIRQSISEGAFVSGPLGRFVQKVSEHAFMVNDDDIAALHQAHYSDDQIFEAAVSAALGAGLYRLERVRAALQTNQPTPVSHSKQTNQDRSLHDQRQVNATVVS